MRLSDIRGERALEVVAELIDPISNIAEDETAKELFAKKAVPDGMTAKKFVLGRVRAGLPSLIRGHKKDIMHILATLSGQTDAEYAETLTMEKLFVECIELFGDPAFTMLFSSARDETPSGGI